MTNLWLIDRSRVADGRGFCERSRLLGYHIGPNGYGIQRKATKLPLMTGILGHDGLAPILAWCRDNDALVVEGLNAAPTDPNIPYLPVPLEVVRAAVAGAHEKYQKVVEVRGFAYLADQEDTKMVITEQRYLIEGLIWAWCLEVLPETLRRGRIVEVEQDDTFVFGCTCGLGDGILTKADHEARDCEGIGLQCRPDFLLETRLTNELEYHEFKTTGHSGPSFKDKWEVMMQMFAATLDAERRWGRHVQSVYIHGLIKGKRQGDYNPDTKRYDGGVIRQQSIYCYGWRKPANPPMEKEEWAAQYEYTDPETGKNHRLPKSWVKAPVWELPDGLLEQGVGKAEFWVQWMPKSVRAKTLTMVGPLSRQTLMVDHFIEEARGEEARWQAGLWELYELAVAILAESGTAPEHQSEETWWLVVWPDERFQMAMNRLFPRSYECRRYGMKNRCQFEDVCLFREGWAAPIASGGYIPRRPHHKDELEQAQTRGLLPEDGLADDEEVEFEG